MPGPFRVHLDLTAEAIAEILDRLPTHCGRRVTMRMTCASLLALIASSAMALCASAETVRFPAAATPPTPLQERLARERGQPVSRPPVVELTGELYRPGGEGPFPAVVALHGCAGAPSRENVAAAGAAYAALGYALLIVDSFGPRGVAQRCQFNLGVPVDRVMDAYGGLLYLAGLPFIDPDRIAVVGYSQGADIALDAVRLGGVATQFDRHFRAAVAYYPWCVASDGAVAVPTVILIGELDEATPARNCETMMAQRSGQGADLRLIVYPGAHHSFNSTRLRGKPEVIVWAQERIQRGCGRSSVGRRKENPAPCLWPLAAGTVRSRAGPCSPAIGVASHHDATGGCVRFVVIVMS